MTGGQGPSATSASGRAASVENAPLPRIGVLGATGRMGRAVVRLARESGMQVVVAIAEGSEGNDVGEIAGVGTIGTKIDRDVRAIARSNAEVVIDFSSPKAVAEAAAVCADARIAFVSGTTGLDAAALAALDAAARGCAVLWEPNMSVGVHVLSKLVERAVAALGSTFDVEIVETHHRAKVDAPSGTAVRLADAVKQARAGRIVNGREGRPGPRAAEEIGVHAVRGGDVVGDHTVFLFGEGERVELTHRASSRDLFAHGALRAARFLVGKAPGRYRLADMLDA